MAGILPLCSISSSHYLDRTLYCLEKFNSCRDDATKLLCLVLFLFSSLSPAKPTSRKRPFSTISSISSRLCENILEKRRRPRYCRPSRRRRSVLSLLWLIKSFRDSTDGGSDGDGSSSTMVANERAPITLQSNMPKIPSTKAYY